MAICPMPCPVLLPRPAAINSSSRHTVPSKKTSGAPASRDLRSSVTLGAGGEEIEILARRLVTDPKPERIAGAVVACRDEPCPPDTTRSCRATANGRISMPEGEPSGSAGSNALSTSIGCAPHILFAQHVEDAVGLQDRQHPGVRIDRERPAFAHRQQPRDRVDFAIGQDDARDRTVAKLAGLRVKLRRRDQLLAQIGRRIDQKPVIAVGADRDRGLGALKLGMFGSRCPANRTAAIPLRNATTRRGAQDDDAKHDPSPGISNSFNCIKKLRRWTQSINNVPNQERVTPGGPPESNMKLSQPLTCGRRTHTC